MRPDTKPGKVSLYPVYPFPFCCLSKRAFNCSHVARATRAYLTAAQRRPEGGQP